MQRRASRVSRRLSVGRTPGPAPANVGHTCIHQGTHASDLQIASRGQIFHLRQAPRDLQRPRPKGEEKEMAERGNQLALATAAAQNRPQPRAFALGPRAMRLASPIDLIIHKRAIANYQYLTLYHSNSLTPPSRRAMNLAKCRQHTLATAPHSHRRRGSQGMRSPRHRTKFRPNHQCHNP